MDTNDKMLGVESARRDLEGTFNLEKFEEIKKVEAAMEASADMDCNCFAGYSSDEVESIVNEHCTTQPNSMEIAEEMDMNSEYSNEIESGCGCNCRHNNSMEIAEEMDMNSEYNNEIESGCGCNCRHNNSMEIAEEMDMNSEYSNEIESGCGCCSRHNNSMEVAEEMDMNSEHHNEVESDSGYAAMEAASDEELAEDAYYRNMDTAYEAAGDADFRNWAFEQERVKTANGVHAGMTPDEIAEEMRTERENYEEFSEDFDESNPQESGYAGITDEANADSLEVAADEYFDEDVGYTSTADYTMISDEDMSGS